MITHAKEILFAFSAVCWGCNGTGIVYTSVTDSTTGEEVDVPNECALCGGSGTDSDE